VSNFHTTLSRRDFMKGVGLIGAGLGAAAATVPVFHDMDELVANSSDVQQHPWFVKTREFKNPTTEINWSNLKRQEGFHKFPMFPNMPVATHEEYVAAGLGNQHNFILTWGGSLKHSPEKMKILLDKAKSEFPDWDPGYLGMGSLRTTALTNASRYSAFTLSSRLRSGGSTISPIMGALQQGGSAFPNSFEGWHLFPEILPQNCGIPKWEASSEENNKMVRTAARFFGAYNIGIGELDEDTKKFIHLTDSGQKTINFRDVDAVTETATEQIIPNKCKYLITVSIRQCFEGTRRQAGIQENYAVWNSYSTHPVIMGKIQEFIINLGYECCMPNLMTYLSVPYGILHGLGEMSRAGSPVITPFSGLCDRGMWTLITDLPLDPTPPIDFGAFKFCETCGICADACPFSLIQTRDMPPAWERAGLKSGVLQGTFKGYRTEMSECVHCPQCQSVCPFNSDDLSFVHQMVKACTSTLHSSPLNGFFANMEHFMGYGRKDPEGFWEIDNLPVHGFNSLR
jgi:epoxyqueuosine reductase